MAPGGAPHRPRQSANEIPLQVFDSNGSDALEHDRDGSHGRSLSDRGRALFRGHREGQETGRYALIAEESPSPPIRVQPSGTPRVFVQTPLGQQKRIAEVEDDENEMSPVADRGAFQAAIGFAGLSFQADGAVPEDEDDLEDPPTRRSRPDRPSLPSLRTNSFDMSPVQLDDGPAFFSPGVRDEDDLQPLTEPFPDAVRPTTLQPGGQRHDRQNRLRGASNLSVRFKPMHGRSGSRLGDDLNAAEAGVSPPTVTRSASRSLSPSAAESPLMRTGTMLRKMSQRVVNLSHEPEVTSRQSQSLRRRRSSGPRARANTATGVQVNDFATVDGSASLPSPDSEKTPSPIIQSATSAQLPPADRNPLRGKSLGLFSPDSRIRRGLLSFLTNPFVEPTVLLLIVVQTVVLAVGAGQSVYTHPRPAHWGGNWADFILICIFVVYTVEVIFKVIVSGLIFNAPEYSTIDRSVGIRAALAKKADDLFTLQRRPSARRQDTGFSAYENDPPPLLRSFTGQDFQDDVPGTSRQAQKMRLARRAFLRHSFNRVDFVAVGAFWISFVLQGTGIQDISHIYVFDMLSCLRILRLLQITSGTSVILRSLKRAASTLLNIGFLIGFFWLVFAIVGLQSFKSSLRRYCVWEDPLGQNNYTQNQIGNFQFCGGWLETNGTGLTEKPWVFEDGSHGTAKAKGFLCPVGSKCVSSTNPYNNTVSYDNIFNSLELVFVIMTSNTFTDLMYYVCDSDYLAAALFSAFGIIVMSLWLINLLIAVITSSFQVIREESKSSAFMADEIPVEDDDIHDDFLYKKDRGLKRFYGSSQWLWIAIIIFGLVTQCLRHDTMSRAAAKFIDVSQIGVTLVLLIEIIIRFIIDWRGFFRSARNCFDLFLAVVTSVILLPQIRHSRTVYAWLTIFQILRIYRVVLAVEITRNLIMMVFRHVSGLLNLILFTYLLTFLAAIFAAQLFRGTLPEQDSQGNELEVTFATIWNSFLGMYQLLSSENWTTVLYNVTRFNVVKNTGWIGAAFLIMWYILANFIVLNMFIAVIQENFDVSEDQKRMQQVRMFLQQKELGSSSHGTLSLSTIFKLGRVSRQDPLDFGSAATEMLLKDAVIRDFLDDMLEPDETDGAHVTQTNPGFKPQASIRSWQMLYQKLRKILFDPEPNPFYTKLQLSKPYEELDPRTLAKEVVSAAEHRKVVQRQYLRKHPWYNVSLFMFKPTNPIRRACQRIVGPGRGSYRMDGVEPDVRIWYAFSAFIYSAIVAMVILACITTPLFQKEYFATHDFTVKNWFTFSDIGFAALFTVEAIIRVVADGFFWTPNAYFRSSWGFIDGIVLVTMWVNVVTSLYDPGGGSRAVGAFKALRALRLLNVSDSARDTFHSVIILGGWKVVSAAFVSLSLLIPFAIYGLNLFAGAMTSCNDNNSGIYNLTDCVDEYASSPYNWNVLAPRKVANSYYNFDSFGGSLFILFQIVSQEGWVDVEWSAESITGVFTQPQAWSQQGNAAFFVIFNLLGAVFVLTLFVSVFMRNYTEQTGVAFLTADQRSWLELRKLLRQVAPSKRPSTKKRRDNWQEWCYRRAVTKTGWWHRTVTGVLLLHLLLLCLEFYPTVAWWDRTRDYLFLALNAVYTANIFIRITGLSWARFRRSAWDMYSLVAVLGTTSLTVLLFTNFKNETFEQLHKLFLVSIVLLLIPRNNQLDQLFKTAAASLTSIANLLATWFVLFLVYAIALTQTFGLTRFGSNETGNLNVRTVPKALILLFRSSMGEGWNQVMEDFARIEPPTCTVGARYYDTDCGGAPWARALFVSWNILSMYIFVNLFISLIYESFSYVYQRSSGLWVLSREEIRRFKQGWAEYDPNGTGYISKAQFPRFLGELSGIFEMRIYDGDFSVRALLEDCRIRPHRSSALPVDGPSDAPQIDLDKLNERLAELPVEQIRMRRKRMNTFYEEVLVSADPDLGVSFNALLMILAHYKVINENKSLRLEEYLRRRARLQRVEEAVNRNIVVGFFDTLYWSRRFRRSRDSKKHARVTEVPQFGVPEIFIHDETETSEAGVSKAAIPSMIVTPVDTTPPDLYGSQHASWANTDAGGSNAGSSPPGSTMRDRSGSIQLSPRLSPIDTSPGPSMGASRLTAQHGQSPSQHSIQPEWHFAAALERVSPPASPRLDGASGGQRNRANSAVSQTEMMDVFDNSAWGESMRRSHTTRRRTSQRRPS